MFSNMIPAAMLPKRAVGEPELHSHWGDKPVEPLMGGS